MSETQFVCALFALPFLTLSIAWLVGLAALDHYERRVELRAIRKLKAMLREEMR